MQILFQKVNYRKQVPSPIIKTTTIKRYFFHSAFNGLNYHGWQRQPAAVSVQEILEGVFSKVFKESLSVYGCGRTDAQVHASQYFFHADIAGDFDFDLMKFRLNRTLPPDMAIFEILPVTDNAHARFDAVRRTYDYFLHTRKDPFLNGASALYADRTLDLAKMKAAVDLLPKYDDYYAFCRSPNSFAHTVCRVSSAYLWVDKTGSRLRFQITANRFLTGMIRIIVGRLLEIGTGKMSVDEFEAHLAKRHTPRIINSAHPQGLYLSKIVYPYLELEPCTDFAAMFQYEEGYWGAI